MGSQLVVVCREQMGNIVEGRFGFACLFCSNRNFQGHTGATWCDAVCAARVCCWTFVTTLRESRSDGSNSEGILCTATRVPQPRLQTAIERQVGFKKYEFAALSTQGSPGPGCVSRTEADSPEPWVCQKQCLMVNSKARPSRRRTSCEWCERPATHQCPQRLFQGRGRNLLKMPSFFVCCLEEGTFFCRFQAGILGYRLHVCVVSLIPGVNARRRAGIASSRSSLQCSNCLLQRPVSPETEEVVQMGCVPP